MKRKQVWIALALTVPLILALAVIFGCTTATRSPGQIELSTAEFDFGTIPNTDPVSQTLQVRNVGQGKLEITGVSTSCGCTTAEIGSHRLSPGATTDLTVTYDPQVHGGETGEFVRVVYIRSNDPNIPEASLTIRATVVEPGEGPEEPTASGDELEEVASSLYKAFVCPCCGQDIGSCTCGMADERRGLIDHQDLSIQGVNVR